VFLPAKKTQFPYGYFAVGGKLFNEKSIGFI